MFKNYFKIAVRNLRKNKAFSFINISGLAIGMAAAMLILLWIQNEVSHDRFYKKIDRIYTLNNRDTFNGQLWAWNTTPKILAPTLQHEYPEVEDAVRMAGCGFLFSVGDKHLHEQGDFTDSAFFNVFAFPLIKGNAATALNNVNGIVLTQKFAKTLFGNEDALDKVLKIDSVDYFTVTGVMKDLPNNTAFSFSYLLPWSYLKKINGDDAYWGNNSIQSYLLLKPGVSLSAFNNKIKNVTIDHSKGTGDLQTSQVFAYPLKDQWLYSKSENGQYIGGRIETVKLFGIIAAFILLIACINFMNLSTARSEKRAKEVGIRKVVGAQKNWLIVQFIGESILLSCMAFIIALLIVIVSLPAFNTLVSKQLHMEFGNFYFWLFALAFILFTGILAGSYPAFYLSSYKPVKVLKGTFKSASALVTPRKILVVLQFTFAIALIICTIIVEQQIKYAQERDSGYAKDKLVYTSLDGEVGKNYLLIKNDLLNSGAAVAITKSMSPITQRYSDGWGWKWTGSTADDDKTDFIRMASDADFVKTLGVHLMAGRDIDIYKYPTDSTAMLLNETAVKVMHLKNPVGTIVQADGKTWHVVGVLKDFIYGSPYEKVQQLAVLGPASWFNIMHFKLNPANSTEKDLQLAAGIFKKYNPQYPFDYKFVDEAYALKFQEEQQTGTLAALFAGLTIFISCLGLFGLATYMAENRIKEIGVRKVLGASVVTITALLSKDFLKLVIISLIIASPVAWWAMNKWLNTYSYHIGIKWWVFGLAGLLSVVIAIATVSYQSIKAALANPVKSLRTE
ncbi:MAG TPA: ABC transporter permease [Chitinophagaceae bacterium]|nr:ABC transporter permease [Chitinophagaceae bacterium]